MSMPLSLTDIKDYGVLLKLQSFKISFAVLKYIGLNVADVKLNMMFYCI